MIKKLLFALYSIVVIVLAIATIYEKYHGTNITHDTIYGANWFIILWCLGTSLGITYFIKQKVCKPFVVLLHLSFIVILLGACLTHYFSHQGFIHLRMNDTTDTYYVVDKTQSDGYRTIPLAFRVRLNNFRITYRKGTQTPTNFTSTFTILPAKEDMDKTKSEQEQSTIGQVSMNNIFTFHGIRFTQMGYDPDLRGSSIALNSDPYGIPFTYIGYALLFLSLIWMLIAKDGQFRKLLRSPLLKRGLLLLGIIFTALSYPSKTYASTTLPKDVARNFGNLYIAYNGRICPLETYAIDFTEKLYGKKGYKNYSAEQVLLGFIFWNEEWDEEPIIKIKSTELRHTYRIGAYTSLNSFFLQGEGGYRLGNLIQEYYQGNKDKLHEEAAKLDEKIMLIMELRKLKPLLIFPLRDRKGSVTWVCPTDTLNKDIPEKQQAFIHDAFPYIYDQTILNNYENINKAFSKIKDYQEKYCQGTLPSPLQTKAEHIYNSLPLAMILFIVCLTMGFLMLPYHIWRIIQRDTLKNTRTTKRVDAFSLVIMLATILLLTTLLILRWIISGKIPMANGYETMLSMSWFILLFSFSLARKFRITLTFGFLLSGFFLLVNYLIQMDPAITPTMPVLNSPLLSIHVSIIMMAYALLSLTFICGITALIIQMVNHRKNNSYSLEALMDLSQLFLYPAITTLGLGIFIGAIWANISWGAYWSWDPKETWALITLLIYAAPLHLHSIPALSRPIWYHIYLSVAFLSILMTYFGVNYFLGGMHAYA